MNYRFLYRVLLCQLAVSMSFLYAARASAADWTIQDLGTLVGGPNPQYSYAYGINFRGHIVGESDTYAFLYDSNGMHQLPTLGGTYPYGSVAFAINEKDQVVGKSITSGNAAYHAFLYDSSGIRDLGALDGIWSDARGINAQGQVVGRIEYAGTAHAFFYDGTQMIDLSSLGGSSQPGIALGINNSGQVVGFMGPDSFLYYGGSISYLGTLGGPSSQAYAINDSGQIVGVSWNSNNWSDAFLYQDGIMQDLGNLGAGSWTPALSINGRGQAVGYGTTSSGATHAFLYDGTMRDLTILPEVVAAGWQGPFIAYANNDSGQIVGYGTTGAGVRHAYRLHPQSMSRYMQTTDVTKLNNLGCSQTNQSGVMVLDFGAPATDGKGTYGATTFQKGGAFATTSAIELGVKAFLDGYYACHGQSQAKMTVAVGTSNSGKQVSCAHGEAWGTMTGRLVSYAASRGYSDHLKVVGASDMELSYNSPSITKTWADCYARTAPVGYYDYGDAAGCPPVGSCNNGWTIQDVLYVAFSGPAQPTPVPEIYGPSTALQWANLSLLAYNSGSAYAIPAAMTTWQACKDLNSKEAICRSPNTPVQSWQQLMDALYSISAPVQNILYSSDLTWQN